MASELTDLAGDAPLVPSEDWRRLNKLQVERAAARLLEKQYAGEEETWSEAQRADFIAKTVRLIDTITDFRARASFTNIVGQWMRLGKREPAEAAQIGQQVNIMQMDEGTAREILARLANGENRAAKKNENFPIIDIEIDPSAASVERLRAAMEDQP